jgi:type II secretory pathway pseudopilin PulG
MRHPAPPRPRSIAKSASIAILALASAYAAPAVYASTQAVKDSAHLHLISGGGTALTEQGKASGSIPGTVRLWLKLQAYTATASFTIYTKSGNISGHASGKLKFGKSGYDSFAGAASITHGTGRYAHASGTGTFYGSVYRGNYKMSVQVYGQLHY